MVTFARQAISPAGFAGLRARLTDGSGFFEDPPFKYGVFDSDVYRADVVRRTSAITFAQTIAALPPGFKAVINGNYFFGSSQLVPLYALAASGVVDPADVQSRGDVKQGGSIALPDGGEGPDFFFFGRDSSATPIYSVGQGNPPGFMTDGMGGLGPLIMPNPVTFAPLKFGVGNRYKSDPKKSSRPVTPDDFIDLVQRNNNTYVSMNSQGATGDGVGAIAFISTEKLLLLVVKANGVNGNLDTVRDKLFSVGCSHACFVDGASSACLAVDGAMVVPPAAYKDNSIETGFGMFLYRPPPPTNVRVTFDRIRVRDDEEVFGAGTWTVTANVNGAPLTLLNGAEVDTGDEISMSFDTTQTVPSGGTLTIAVSGVDSDDGDDLGNLSVTFSATSSPRFGAGTHTRRSSEGSFEVTFRIEIVP